MADGNNKPGGNSPLENNGDQDKTLQILQKADDRIRALLVSTDAANKSMGKFSSAFINATKNVKLLNDELRTLKTLSSNIKIPNIKGGKVSGGAASSGVVDRKSEELKARLELEKNLKYIKQKFGHIKDSDKSIAEYRSKLYKEHYAKFGVPNVESTDYEKKMTELRHAEALAASGTTAARRNAAKIYENYGEKEKAEAIYKEVGRPNSKAEHAKLVEEQYQNIKSNAEKNKIKEEAQKRYDAENPKDVLKETFLGKFNKKTQRTLKALTDLGKQKGGVLGSISTFAQKLGSNAPAMGVAAVGVGLLVKEIKFLAQCSREAQENVNKAAQALTAMGVGLTDSQTTAMSGQAAKNRLSNRWQNFKNNTGFSDFWNNVAIGVDTVLEAIGGTSAAEPDSVKYAAMAQGTNKAYQSGFNWQSSVNLGEHIYTTLADLVTQRFTQFKGNESEVTAALVDAIFSGNSKSIEDFGLTVDNDVLTGYMATRNERNSGQENIDMVNVEYTDAYKQLARYEMLLDQLSQDSIKDRQKEIQQWKTLGSVMEKCKQTLFGFDEVIALNAYDPTIPEYGWQWSNRVAVPSDATKEEADEALKNAEESGITTPETTQLHISTPVKLDKDTVKVEPDTVKLDSTTVKLDPTTVTLDTTDFNKGIELLRTIFNNFAYNILTLINKLNNFGISTGTPGVGPTGDITTPITETPANQDDWRTLLYKQLEQDFLNRLANGGSGPSSQASGLKEWGFAWGGPGSVTDILVDVTGNNNYIGNRRTMTESEARSWANANYYRFGPDEDGSTPARGVDVGNFYQPNSASSSGGDDSSIFEDILSVVGDLTGITKLANRVKGFQEGDYDIWGLLSGIGSFAFSPWSIMDDALFGDVEKELRPVENGGIGTRGLDRFNRDMLNNANIDYGNTGENAAGSNGIGGDSITVNLTLSGLNISNNQSDWQWVAQKIAEEIDVQRQRRGELNYGASY